MLLMVNECFLMKLSRKIIVRKATLQKTNKLFNETIFRIDILVANVFNLNLKMQFRVKLFYSKLFIFKNLEIQIKRNVICNILGSEKKTY